jgi:hypothetical protein
MDSLAKEVRVESMGKGKVLDRGRGVDQRLYDVLLNNSTVILRKVQLRVSQPIFILIRPPLLDHILQFDSS